MRGASYHAGREGDMEGRKEAPQKEWPFCFLFFLYVEERILTGTADYSFRMYVVGPSGEGLSLTQL